METSTLGWRRFLKSVNLKDFSGMVLAELGLIGLSIKVALQSFLRLPLGPPTFVVIIVLTIVRLLALVLVILVLGSAVLATMLIRRVQAIGRGQGEGT